MSAPADRFLRSVAVVLTGTAAAQAIPLLGSLVLARLYAPAEFGLFATWLGMVALAAVMLTGRYEQALALEADGPPRRVAVLAVLAIVGAACVPLALIVGGVWLSSGTAGAAGDPRLWAAGVATAGLIAVAQTWQSWAAAEGRFHDLSLMRVAQAGSVTGIQIVVGLAMPTALSMALAHGAGVAVGVLMSSWRLPLSLDGLPRGPALRGAAGGFLSRQRRFPALSLPADSVNTAAGQLPLLIVTSRFGPDIAGLLSLTLRMVGGPLAVLGSSVLDVFRRRSAATFRATGQCRAEYMQTFKVLGLGSIAVAVPLAIFAEPIFALAFGERWRMSGVIAFWMLPMFALRFVASPLSYMFYVAGKQHVDLFWQVGLLGMTLLTLLLPAHYAAALQLYSAGYAGMYCIYLVLSYRFSKGSAA